VSLEDPDWLWSLREGGWRVKSGQKGQQEQCVSGS
jgi:hypothetical protein